MKAAIYMRVGNPEQLAFQHQTEVLTRQIRGMWGDGTMLELVEEILRSVEGLPT